MPIYETIRINHIVEITFVLSLTVIVFTRSIRTLYVKIILCRFYRIHAGKNRIDSWDSLKHKLRKAFLPYNYERTIYNRFQNLRQGTRSVDEYAAEFFSFLAPSSVQETNDQLVYQFIGGLRQQIPKTLLQINLSTDSEAHQHALLIELNNRSSQSSWFAGVS